MQFTEPQIQTTDNGFKVDQIVYISKLTQVSDKQDYNKLRPLQAKPALASNPRLDISYSMATLSQVTVFAFEKETNNILKLSTVSSLI